MRLAGLVLIALHGCAWISADEYDQRMAGTAEDSGDVTDTSDTSGPTDGDNDGHLSIANGGEDCDDSNPAVHPDAEERCDAVDNDCDGRLYPCIGTPEEAGLDIVGLGRHQQLGTSLATGDRGGPVAAIGAPGGAMSDGEAFFFDLEAGTTLITESRAHLTAVQGTAGRFGQGLTLVPQPFGVIVGEPDADSAMLFPELQDGATSASTTVALSPNLSALTGVLDDADEFGAAVATFRQAAPGVAIGAPSATLSSTVRGAVFAYLGAPPDWSVPNHVVVGAEGDRVGRALALGEWDGSATQADLLVGAPGISTASVFYNPGVGAAFSSSDFSITGPIGAEFGALVGVHQAVGTARDDIIVAAPLDNGGATGGGAVFIFDGDAVVQGTTRAFTQADIAIRGSTDGEQVSTYALGDFDGDGELDIAVGAPEADSRTGAVYVFFGPLASADTDEADATFRGAAQGDRFGATLAFIDIDDDGADELLIAAPDAEIDSVENAGAVYGFWGAAELEQ
ncbi:MAG: FG-GAP repeat protein [Proteobacteria bacterium]|nr:FG-GAP repeat protein [Pseudomonadota bacterium]